MERTTATSAPKVCPPFIDWEYSSNLSLMSISIYVVHSTKETGNMHDKGWKIRKTERKKERK